MRGASCRIVGARATMPELSCLTLCVCAVCASLSAWACVHVTCPFPGLDAALVVGHQAPAAAHTSGLAAAGPAMHDAPAAAQMNPEAKQMAVAAMQKQLAVAKEAAVAPVKKASALDEEAPEEEDAPKESAVEQGEDAVEGLLPPVKSGIKGGEGKVSVYECVCVCLRVHAMRAATDLLRREPWTRVPVSICLLSTGTRR